MTKNHNLDTQDPESQTIDMIFFIVNPTARKLWIKLEKELQIPYSVTYTEFKGHAEKIVKEILQKTNERTLIVSVGGDGTLHECINGAVDFSHAIISSIPAGSGNDFVRGIQKTKNINDAMNLITRRDTSSLRTVDLGAFIIDEKKRHFVNSLGIGIDAEVTYEINQSSIKKWFNIFQAGKLAYIYMFIKRMLTYTRSDMILSIDGKEYHLKKVWFIVIANQPYFGGGIKISPASRMDDGNLEVLAVHSISHLKLLLVFLTVYWGGHLRIHNVDSYYGKRIRIQSLNPVRIQADGESVGSTSVDVQVAEGRLSVYQKQPK